MSYWGICIPEILSEHGVDLDDEALDAVVRDVEACASVEKEYSPVPYVDELSVLKEKIRKLEMRVPCPYCGGKGGSWIVITSHHKSYNDCHHCNGVGWLPH